MPKRKLLAKTRLQSLDRSELNALIQNEAASPTKELLQSHYYVEGSLEELVNGVNCAFQKWRWCEDEYEDYLAYWGMTDKWSAPYRWSYVLATYNDSLCFYTDSYSQGGPCYSCVSYEVVDGCVHIGTDVKAVEATIVVRALAADGDGDLGVEQSATGKEVNPLILQHISTKDRNALADEDFAGPNRTFPIDDQDDVDSAAKLIGKAANPNAVKARIKKIAKRKGLTVPEAWTKKSKKQGEDQTMAETTTKIKQDAVPDTAVLADAAASDTGVMHSDDNPKGIVKGETDANSGGAGVITDPMAAADVTTARPVAGAGNMNTPGTGIIDSAMNDIEAGTKQAAAAPATPVLIQAAHRDSTGQSLAYMKLQSVDTDATGNKLMRLQGIVTRADIVNTEGEVYPLSVWQTNLPKMNELAQGGKFIGKLEHPDKELGLQDAALKFEKFWLQGSDVWADATVIPTFPDGQNLQAMIEAGVSVDFSSRGYGTMKQQEYRGVMRKVVQDDFNCIAFDAVWHGASTGSGVTQVTYQSQKTTNTGTEQVQGGKDNTMPELTEAQKDAATVLQASQLKEYRKGLIAESEGKLSELGQDAYKRALKACDTMDAMFLVKQNALPAITAAFPAETITQSAAQTWAPTFIVKKTQEEIAPKSVGEMFDRMVADIPDAYPSCQSADLPTGTKFQSPRAACREMLGRIAQSSDRGFHGLSAARALLALEQGKLDRADNCIQQSKLYQSFSADSTIANGNANNDGAPLSAPLIFPLIRRVFPRYIMNEIASIQPMDRPQGKIFYLDAYRTEDPSGQEKRIDLNTSANPFNSTYADNNTEGATAELIRLRLTSLTVSAYTKKIGAQWSIEEMQDLRAYHGLDAAQELMGSTAKEMALEWNKTVLDDMLAQATAGSLTFGTVAPASGFPNQKDWDEYIWNYVAKLDSLIFAKRNNPMTHMICGVDAALALNKSFRGAFTLGNNSQQEMELYPGTTFYGTINGGAGASYKVFKTNFWTTGTTNGSKILGLRRGGDWSDTPYIWAPYTDYVTPQLTDPSDFSQRQGIMSRAAKQVVVSDAMGFITVASGQTGAII